MKLQHRNAVVTPLSFPLIAGSDTLFPSARIVFLVNMTSEQTQESQKRNSDDLSCMTSPGELDQTCWETRGADTVTGTAPVRPRHTSVLAGRVWTRVTGCPSDRRLVASCLGTKRKQEINITHIPAFKMLDCCNFMNTMQFNLLSCLHTI